MKGTARLLNPDAIEAAISVTMTIGEWKVIREALKSETYWPSGKFASMISDAVGKVENLISVNDRELI